MDLFNSQLVEVNQRDSEMVTCQRLWHVAGEYKVTLASLFSGVSTTMICL